MVSIGLAVLLSLAHNMRGSRTSFTFDPDNFPDPKAYLASLKKQFGVKICVWSKFRNE